MSETTAAAGTGAASEPIRVRVSWERLLRVAGAAECIALLAVAAMRGDVEAAAVGVGFAVGLALLRFRGGLLGRILLGLGSFNVLVWMSLATLSILTGGEGVAALAVPALLTALSVTVLAAAVGSAVARRRPSVVTRGSGLTVAVGSGLFALLLVLGALVPASSRSAAQAGDLVLSTAKLRFTESELTAEAGMIGVVVDNQDLFWHTFTIDELDVDLAVPVNGERRIAFDAPAGSYTYYCRVPGHEIPMRGTLTVR